MDILKPLIALLAIVNPIGVMPFFIHFTDGFSREQRRRTIRVAAISAFVVIAVSAVAGLRIIEFFGISLASFQVGGGMLLLISSLQMLNAQPAESRSSDLERRRRQGRRRRLDRDRAADDPAADRAGDDLDHGDLCREDAALVGARDPGRLRRRHRRWRSGWRSASSAAIARVLGRTGINVMTRLMGLLLAALAVEVMSDGLVKLFPAARGDGLRLTAEPTATYDYIVFGAGTAGCLLANRLSADRTQARAADRGRRQRRLPLDPHPGRLPLLHRQPAHRLAVRDRARPPA